MERIRRSASLISIVCWVVVAPVAAQNAGEQYHVQSARAVYTPTPPRIDGEVEAAVWDRAEPATGFHQLEPHFGAPPRQQTRVHILYDADNVYILVLCDDTEPDKIVASTMERDADLRSDDHIVISIDSFHDHRNVFRFSTNPIGARVDELVSGQGTDRNIDWDGIWFCKTAVTPAGWLAEIAIPLAQLRFTPQAQMQWGMQFERTVRRTRERTLWNPVPESQRLFGGNVPSYFGLVSGFEGMTTKKRDLQIKPFTVGSGTRNYGFASQKTNGDLDLGMDVKYGLTSTLTADLTYNTDFAEVENDDEQVNLTRFSLFFPEKRDFFTEGAGMFTFGRPQRRSRSGTIRPPQFLLFYSRRIGLEDDEKIPLLGGRG